MTNEEFLQILQPISILPKKEELTKREYFAILTLQGVISVGSPIAPNTEVTIAVKYADALINELSKEIK